MYRYFILTGLLVLMGCNKRSKSNSKLTAQEIVDKSIQVSGGDQFNNSSIGFRFRDAYYTALRNKGDFAYSRILNKEGDSIIDILSNEGFARFINDEFVELSDSLGQVFTASVNSVHYFSVLPFGLNDAAVNKKLMGTETIKEEEYYKIEVTFDAEGGGEDYDDVFIYWMHKQSFKVHYLAYSYAEEDGLGLRFREAYNERYLNGLRFVDYKNYKPSKATANLGELGQQFNKNQLALVSEIVLNEVQVRLLDLK